jgi:vancomycin resistance protein YoaR
VQNEPDQAASAPPRRTRTLIIGILVALLLALIVGRSVVEIVYANRIYPGVSAAGIDLSGATVAQATDTLRAHLGEYEATPLPVQVGDQNLTLTPSQLGLRADPAALAQAGYAAGREASLASRLIGPLFPRQMLVPMTSAATVDRPALTQAVAQVAAQTDRPALNASLTLDPTVGVTPSRVGQTLDQTKAADLAQAYLGGFRTEGLTLPVAVLQPTVTAKDLEPARTQAERLLAGPVVLRAGDQPTTVRPFTVRQALATQPDQPFLTVNASALSGFVRGVATQVDQPARDARLVAANGHVTIDPGQIGRQVDQPATLAGLEQALSSGQLSSTAVVQNVDPAVTPADLQVVAAQAQKLVDAGLVLVADGQELKITPVDLTSLLVVNRSSAGDWLITLDLAKLGDRLSQLNIEFEHPSQDARFGWDSGKVKLLQPEVPAVVIDPAGATKAILAGWQSGRVVIPVTNVKMKIDDAYLAKLNASLKQVIQERSTSFVGSIPERAHNIGLALSHLNGSFVPAGGTFSFNRAIGPTTLAAGFQWGFAYSTDSKGTSQVVPSVGGGICQVATTLFQPVFWSGYQIDERHWHMFVMNHYAYNGYVGLDATVSPDDGLDFKFTNNSDNPMLILAWTEGQTAHISLVGASPNWTVKMAPETVTNVVKPAPGVVRSTSPAFARGRQITLEVAQAGLTAYETRQVIYPDGHVRTLHLGSSYKPAQTSVLVGTG